jgi:copper chaperone
MDKVKIKTKKMMCGHCQTAMTTAISAVEGVHDLDISLADMEVTVTYDPEKTKKEIIKDTAKTVTQIED